MPDRLEDGKKLLCVCDYAGAAAALDGEWPGSAGFDGSLRQLESGAALAQALRGRAGSPATPDGRRSVELLRDVVLADRRRGFRFLGQYSSRVKYLGADAFAFDAAQVQGVEPEAALRWVDGGLDLFRDFPFPRPLAAGLWLERARCLRSLGRDAEAAAAASTALLAERGGATADPSSLAVELRVRREAEELLAGLGEPSLFDLP